jgi:hypothetical protein
MMPAAHEGKEVNPKNNTSEERTSVMRAELLEQLPSFACQDFADHSAALPAPPAARKAPLSALLIFRFED